MLSLGLPRVSRIRVPLRDRGRLAGRLSRLSVATFDGRLGRALIGIVLALHLVGGIGGVRAAPGAIEAASLSAALGQPVPTCHHGDPDHPDAPAPDGCDHCICCQTLSVGVALGPNHWEWRAPARSPQHVSFPIRENAVVRPNRAGRTAARGPPALS